jgi:hypothetical protein
MNHSRRQVDKHKPFFSESLASSPTLVDAIELDSLPHSPSLSTHPLSGAGPSSRKVGSTTFDSEARGSITHVQPSTDSHRRHDWGFLRRVSNQYKDDETASSWPPTAQHRELEADEFHLALTGYTQVFHRVLSPCDNFFAMIATMGLATSIPAILFLVSIYVGGPKAALVNWMLVGLTSIILALCLGEICATMPTSAGLYFFSYKLGGKDNGPFLGWITGRCYIMVLFYYCMANVA